MTRRLLRARWVGILSLTLGMPVTAWAGLPVKVAGELTIGSDLTYPPYGWMDAQRRPQGIDPDLMALIAQGLKLKPVFQDTRFISLLPGVRSGRFDIAASTLTITPERQQLVDFIPYLKSGEALMVRSDMADPPAQAAALCGHTVGVIESAAWIPQLEAQSAQCLQQGKAAIRIRTFDTNPHVIHALISHNIDVQLIDSVMATQVAEQLKGVVKISSDRLLYTETLGIAVSKDRPALRDAIHQALGQLKASGEYETVLRRYGVEAADAQNESAAQPHQQ